MSHPTKGVVNLTIKTIPHQEQRYDTVGDYWPENSTWQFRVSRMGSDDFELLVAIHELVEWWWGQKQGIQNAVIDAFDIAYEKARNRGKHGPDDEPGDDPKCPVYTGHQLASGIERLCAAFLGINWQAYERAFDKLPDHPSVKSARRGKSTRRA